MIVASGFKTLFVITYGYVLVLFHRRDAAFADLVFAALAGLMAYFAFNTGVHENHLFMAAVLALVYSTGVTRHTIACTLVVVLAIVNPLLFYGFDGSGLSHVGNVVIGATIPLTGLVVLLTIYFIWSAARPGGQTLSRGRLSQTSA
jgi:hypothetical protein